MTILELVQPRPDWLGALQIALTRPPGVPERRSGEDPWQPASPDRPRRISDDLAWFRDAMDEPEDNGPRLSRLEQRGVLAAAGFMLHQPDAVPAG